MSGDKLRSLIDDASANQRRHFSFAKQNIWEAHVTRALKLDLQSCVKWLWHGCETCSPRSYTAGYCVCHTYRDNTGRQEEL